MIATQLVRIAPPSKNLVLVQWLIKGEIFDDKSNTLFNLTKLTRYEILKQIYRAKDLSLNTKQDRLTHEMGIEFSDIDVLNQIACMACLPDREKKE